MLGLLTYYRQYIKDFSWKASCLYEILQANSAESHENNRKAKMRMKKVNHVVPSNKSITWTDQHQQLLEHLIECLLHPPVLGFPDFTQPSVLHIDASHEVLKASIFMQADLLALIYHLKVLWLYYAPMFTVYNDNDSLIYILSTAKFNATISRWFGDLAAFHFTIRCQTIRPGRENSDADALLRMPLDGSVV